MRPAIEVWREACVAYGGLSIEGGDEERAAAYMIEAYAQDREAKVVAEIVAELRDQWDRGELVCGDELADHIEAKFVGGHA